MCAEVVRGVGTRFGIFPTRRGVSGTGWPVRQVRAVFLREGL